MINILYIHNVCIYLLTVIPDNVTDIYNAITKDFDYSVFYDFPVGLTTDQVWISNHSILSCFPSPSSLVVLVTTLTFRLVTSNYTPTALGVKYTSGAWTDMYQSPFNLYIPFLHLFFSS